MSKRAEEILELHFGSEYWSIKESEYFNNVINAIDEALGLADVGSSYIVFQDGYEEGIEGMIQLTNKIDTLEDAQRHAKGCKQNTYIAKMVE